MNNNKQMMEYTQEFRDFLELAEQCKQTYIGHGNPNAQILIVANEPGVVNDDFIKFDLEKNLERWRSNISGSCPDNVDVMFDENHNLLWEKFNPLWPYKGQCLTQIKTKMDSDGTVRILNKEKRPTSRSWIQYQKLVNLIYGNSIKVKGLPLDFFKYAFIADFSAVYGKHSNDISREERLESITRRLPLFASDFIRHFPVIIVASGHYIHDFKPLNDLTKVFQGFDKVEPVRDTLGWRYIHRSVDSKRVLIHSKHFASAISDNYITAIASECSSFLIYE